MEVKGQKAELLLAITTGVPVFILSVLECFN